MAILILAIFALLGYTKALYTSTSDVVDLTSKNFDNLVLESNSIWIVEFFAPWCVHCQHFVPEYEKVAQALKGIINVGAVNCEQHKSLESQFVTKGFPTINIFGIDKKNPSEYSGEREAKLIIDAGIEEIKKKVNATFASPPKKSVSNDVVELTDDNFETNVYGDRSWLVQFYAPKCETCNLLAPEWGKASIGLKGKIKLGSLNGITNTRVAIDFEIQDYPSIKFIAAGSRRPSNARNYKGNRTSQDIVKWGMKHYLDGPAPGVHQIINEEAVMEACYGKQICIVTILPILADCNVQCRREHLTLLRNISERFNKRKWGWLWSEAGAQDLMEKALALGDTAFPAMAAVNYEKQKYAILRGAFAKINVRDFLREVSLGRGGMIPVKVRELPTFNEINAWNGTDEQPIKHNAKDEL